jgi:hypothetical protein
MVRVRVKCQGIMRGSGGNGWEVVIIYGDYDGGVWYGSDMVAVVGNDGGRWHDGGDNDV